MKSRKTGCSSHVRLVNSLFASAFLLLSGWIAAETLVGDLGDTEVYYSPKGGTAEAIAKVIDTADESIDVAMYSMSNDAPIFTALEKAVDRGVKVRVILNGANGKNRSISEGLESIGVDVLYVKATQHNKFAIVDGKTLINSSGNWSRGAANKYSENYVIYKDHLGLVDAFQEEFDLLYSRSRDFQPGRRVHPKVHANAPDRTIPDPGEERCEKAFFTSMNAPGSEGVVAEEIIRQIKSAKDSLDIAVAHLDHQGLAEAVLKVNARNQNSDPSDDVKIRVMVDYGEFSSPHSKARLFEKAGIPVRYKFYSLAYEYPRSQKMHHKAVIVDGKTLVSGSYNWSDTAEFSNYENVIVHRCAKNKPLLEAFENQFDHLWNLNRGSRAKALGAFLSKPGDPNYRRYVPIHFDTEYFKMAMTLTRHEIKPFRSVAGKWKLYRNKKMRLASYLDKEKGKFFSNPPSYPFLADGPGILDALGAAGH